MQLDPFFVDDGLLQVREILLGGVAVRRVPRDDLDMFGQALDVFFIGGAKHRLDLEQGRMKMSFDRAIGELFGEFCAEEQRAGLFLREHDGRQPVGLP